MKKILFLLCAFFALSAAAQTPDFSKMGNDELNVQFFKMNKANINVDVFASNFSQINSQLASYTDKSKAELDRISDKYVQRQFYIDLAQIMNLNGALTREEKISYLTMISNPDYQKAVTVLNDLSIYNTSEMMDIMLNGKKIEPLSDKAYMDAINEYCQGSMVDQMMDNMVQGYSQMIPESDKDKFKELINVFRKQLPNYMAKVASEKGVTIKEIQTFIAVSKSPEYKKLINAVSEVMKDPQKMGMQLIKSYALYIDQNSVK